MQQPRTISLYSVLVTLLSIVLIVLLFKQCNEPVIAPTQLRKVVDSFQFKEKLAEFHIDKLATLIDEQDSIIVGLQQQKEKTRVVYRDQVKVVTRQLQEAPPVCDSLKKQVYALMELADDYQWQADSIIARYETQIHYKDSMESLRLDLYADLKGAFTQAIKAADELSVKLNTVQNARKRERWIYAAVGVVAAVLIVKK